MNLVVNINTGTDLSAATFETFCSQKKIDWNNGMFFFESKLPTCQVRPGLQHINYARAKPGENLDFCPLIPVRREANP